MEPSQVGCETQNRRWNIWIELNATYLFPRNLTATLTDPRRVFWTRGGALSDQLWWVVYTLRPPDTICSGTTWARMVPARCQCCRLRGGIGEKEINTGRGKEHIGVWCSVSEWNSLTLLKLHRVSDWALSSSKEWHILGAEYVKLISLWSQTFLKYFHDVSKNTASWAKSRPIICSLAAAMWALR